MEKNLGLDVFSKTDALQESMQRAARSMEMLNR